MFDLQFVTRSFVFLLTFAKPLGLESKYFVRNPTKDDVLLVHANAIDVYDTDNLMSCAVNCNLEDMCLSFGFNEYTLSCVHIKKKIAELNFGNNEVGWSYFQIETSDSGSTASSGTQPPATGVAQTTSISTTPDPALLGNTVHGCAYGTACGSCSNTGTINGLTFCCSGCGSHFGYTYTYSSGYYDITCSC